MDGQEHLVTLLLVLELQIVMDMVLVSLQTHASALVDGVVLLVILLLAQMCLIAMVKGNALDQTNAYVFLDLLDLHVNNFLALKLETAMEEVVLAPTNANAPQVTNSLNESNIFRIFRSLLCFL